MLAAFLSRCLVLGPKLQQRQSATDAKGLYRNEQGLLTLQCSLQNQRMEIHVFPAAHLMTWTSEQMHAAQWVPVQSQCDI